MARRGEGRVTLDVRRRERGAEEERAELARSLREDPPRIPSKHFYDERGSKLFEEITRLPEYYPTRAETELLARLAPEIARLTGAQELVELGSGAATKTRLLLDALAAAGTLRRYVPFDVSDAAVRQSAEALARRYPGLEVHGVVDDFLGELGAIPEGEARLVAFLGSTIGNLRPPEAVEFLRQLRERMAPGESFLLGVDLLKDAELLERAYDDARGITAEFNRNILRVVNRRFGSDFDPDAFGHRAFYDPENRWIEMRLTSTRHQVVSIRDIDLRLELPPGAEILTEISTKFDRDRVEEMFRASGFRLRRWYTGDGALFALALGRA